MTKLSRVAWSALLVGAGVLGTAVAYAPAACAQNGDSGDVSARRQAAQDLADSAFDLLQKGRYSAAAELFRQADETFHSPVFVVFQAKALEKDGKLVAARQVLSKVVDEQLAEYAPDAFRKAQDEARALIEALDAKIPTLTFVIRGAQGATVTVNGDPVSDLDTPMQVDPGQYEIAAENDGRTDSTTMKVDPGDRATVDLDVSDPTAIDPIGDDPEPDDPGEGVPVWVWPTVAYGVGGVGLIMGVAAGGAFLSKQSALKDACENDGDGDPNSCPPDQEGEGDSVKTLGNVSTAGWVIAGLGAAVGTVLLLTLDEDDDGGTAELVIGPTSIGLTGRF